MGSGKTTIGRMLSKAANLLFVDLDEAIERAQGKSISLLFKEVGEARFRELERDMLVHYAKGEPCLISTGGGVPCHFDNMEVMNQSGVTIYLKGSPHALATRLKDAIEVRPLLKGVEREDLPAHIGSMLSNRETFYLKADHVVEIDELTDKAVLERCLSILGLTRG